MFTLSKAKANNVKKYSQIKGSNVCTIILENNEDWKYYYCASSKDNESYYSVLNQKRKRGFLKNVNNMFEGISLNDIKGNSVERFIAKRLIIIEMKDN